MKKISIVVSVYNEEPVLEKFYQDFEKMKDTLAWDYELIFVNDGSQDRSAKILDEIGTDRHKRCKNYTYKTNTFKQIVKNSAKSFGVAFILA